MFSRSDVNAGSLLMVSQMCESIFSACEVVKMVAMVCLASTLAYSPILCVSELFQVALC
jgi:hypothetical protein